jgi:hypothetical protein
MKGTYEEEEWRNVEGRRKKRARELIYLWRGERGNASA